MNLNRFFTLSAAALLLVPSSCSRQSSDRATVIDEEVTERVSVAEVNEETIRSEFSSFGTVSYLDKADVSSLVEGTVVRLLVDEGDRVTKGELLALIDTEELDIKQSEAEAEIVSAEAAVELARQQLEDGKKQIEAKFISIKNAEAKIEQLKAELEQVSRNYENKKQLFEIEGVTAEELQSLLVQKKSAETELFTAEGELAIQNIGFRDIDITQAGLSVPQEEEERIKVLIEVNTRTLQAELTVAEARLHAARSNLQSVNLLISRSEIRAPIQGVIAAKNIYLGEKASTETPLFTIFSQNALIVQAEIPEQETRLIQKGQRVEIRSDLSDRCYTGTLYFIAPYTNAESRTTAAKIRLDDVSSLRPGMFVRLTIETGEPYSALVVPVSALIKEETGTYLFLVRNSRLFKTQIEVAKEEDDRAVISSGISQGDIVAVTPGADFSDGMEVEILP
jgi:RND family efflux transporter MFP subunit